MSSLTYLHYIYLAVIVAVIALMIAKHDVVIPCVVGLFILGMCYSGGNPIAGAQAVFNGMMAAGTDLFDIMLVIGIMVAMLKSLEEIGADRMMIEPAAKLIKSPLMAFFVIAAVMYVCASFFWPTPATALVGTILVPIAVSAGLSPIMACLSLNMAGHGMGLSGDLVLQGAPAISAGSSGAPIEEILAKGGMLAWVAGIVAFAVAFVLYRKEILTPVHSENAILGSGKEVKEPHKCAKFFAVLTPALFFLIVIRILIGAFVPSVSKIFGGDATALLGGTGAMILILVCIVVNGKGWLERVTTHLKHGMMFSIKIFAAVIPIAAFFFTGNPETAPTILGEGCPGFLFDLGQAVSEILPLHPFPVALGIAIIGGITGLDGSGFSGVPLVAGLAAAIGGPLGYNVAALAALGQVSAIWVGGGCLCAWAFGAVASAGVAGVEPGDLVRKNFIPVMAGLIAATIVTTLML